LFFGVLSCVLDDVRVPDDFTEDEREIVGGSAGEVKASFTGVNSAALGSRLGVEVDETLGQSEESASAKRKSTTVEMELDAEREETAGEIVEGEIVRGAQPRPAENPRVPSGPAAVLATSCPRRPARMWRGGVVPVLWRRVISSSPFRVSKLWRRDCGFVLDEGALGPPAGDTGFAPAGEDFGEFFEVLRRRCCWTIGSRLL